MNFVRNTRRYNYQCVNGARSRVSNVGLELMALVDNPRRALSEADRLANRARAAEKREAAQLRREQDAQEQERLRHEVVMLEVNRLIAEKMEEVRADLLNEQRLNRVPERMDVDDDEVVLRIPEPFEARDIVVIENDGLLGFRGANRMNGELFGYIFFSNHNNKHMEMQILVVLKNEAPSVIMASNSAMKAVAVGRANALENADLSSIPDALSDGLEDISSTSFSQEIQLNQETHNVDTAGVSAFQKANEGAGSSKNSAVLSPVQGIEDNAGSVVSNNGDISATVSAAQEVDGTNSNDVSVNSADLQGVSTASTSRSYSITLSSSNPLPLDTESRKMLEEILRQIEDDEMTERGNVPRGEQQ